MYIQLYLEKKSLNDINYLDFNEDYLFLGHIIRNNQRIGSISFKYDKKLNLIYIDFVFISSEFKGNGYSRELLKYLSKTFNNAKISGIACNDKEAFSYWKHMGAVFGCCKRCIGNHNCLNKRNYCKFNSNLYFELDV